MTSGLLAYTSVVAATLLLVAFCYTVRAVFSVLVRAVVSLRTPSWPGHAGASTTKGDDNV